MNWREWFVPADEFIRSIKWFCGLVLALHWVGILPDSSIEGGLMLAFIALYIADR